MFDLTLLSYLGALLLAAIVFALVQYTLARFAHWHKDGGDTPDTL